MIIDDKGKLFGKISIIDILVVCLVLAGIAGAYYKFGRSNTISAFVKPDKIELTFFSEDIPKYAGEAINPGDLVKDRLTDGVFGKVKEVALGPDIYYAANADGKMVKSSKEGYASLKIIVEGNGRYQDTGVTFNNKEYYVYNLLEIRVGNTAVYARVQSISKIKG
ncbi:MAG: DUF4330 domain-containing protein [Ruminiclostridium sp.]|nr:DUF4330 domain-containing protein [Ruminiclostridium sp.]